ncbi:MAG: hypothetical protein EOP84_25845, partial [Verrucomicrobiaceae bacterium]
MAVVSHRLRIVYFPIPKIASSSIKLAIYKADTGRDFMPEPLSRGGETEIHNVYEAQPFPVFLPLFERYSSFAIVRDPVERLLSAHRHRVMMRRDIEEARSEAENLGLPIAPDLTTFVTHLDTYRSISWMVDHHVAPQRQWLPKKLDSVSILLPMQFVNHLPEILRKASGVDLQLPHVNDTGGSRGIDQIDSKMRDLIKRYYSADVSLYEEAMRRR